jgi:hypothetical protein
MHFHVTVCDAIGDTIVEQHSKSHTVAVIHTITICVSDPKWVWNFISYSHWYPVCNPLTIADTHAIGHAIGHTISDCDAVTHTVFDTHSFWKQFINIQCERVFICDSICVSVTIRQRVTVWNTVSQCISDSDTFTDPHTDIISVWVTK